MIGISDPYVILKYGKQLRQIRQKTKTIKNTLEPQWNHGTVAEPLDEYMMIPVYEKVTEQITTESKYRKQEILNAYTDLKAESLLPFIKQVLEEEAMNIDGTEMKGRNGLKRWLKERIGFADISESTRLGNLHAKALDSSVEHLNYKKKK